MINFYNKLLAIINIFLSIITFFTPVSSTTISILALCGWICCLLATLKNDIENNEYNKNR